MQASINYAYYKNEEDLDCYRFFFQDILNTDNSSYHIELTSALSQTNLVLLFCFNMCLFMYVDVGVNKKKQARQN